MQTGKNTLAKSLPMLDLRVESIKMIFRYDSELN